MTLPQFLLVHQLQVSALAGSSQAEQVRWPMPTSRSHLGGGTGLHGSISLPLYRFMKGYHRKRNLCHDSDLCQHMRCVLCPASRVDIWYHVVVRHTATQKLVRVQQMYTCKCNVLMCPVCVCRFRKTQQRSCRWHKTQLLQCVRFFCSMRC